jgi:hypothetical protein
MYSIDLSKISDNSNNSDKSNNFDNSDNSDNSVKPIGFLQEDFHSEVLDFLFELCSNIYPNRQLVLYNYKDRYDNKKIYLQKYKNLITKNLNHFIPDLISKKFHKTFIISYDNIFHLKFFENYKDQLVFMAHSKKHINSYEELNIKYFSLTPLLHEKNYMLPIVNKMYDNPTKLISGEIIEKFNNNLNSLKNKSINDNLKIIMTVGYFLENNKNLKLIDELLNTERFMLIVFTPELTNELQNFINKHPKYVFSAIGLSTELLKYSISYLNINHILFTPPFDSHFFKESWSGTLAFGFDNNLKVIMPEEIVKIYNLKNDHVIPYKYNNNDNDNDNIVDIKDLIINDKIIYNTDLQIWKNEIFSKNKEIIKFFL